MLAHSRLCMAWFFFQQKTPVAKIGLRNSPLTCDYNLIRYALTLAVFTITHSLSHECCAIVLVVICAIVNAVKASVAVDCKIG